MSPLKKRFITTILFFVSASIGVVLICWVFQENIMYFYMPSDLTNEKISLEKPLRLGGYVEKGSLKKRLIKNKQEITFIITDRQKKVVVLYEGILPDLFREGQGIIAEGKIIKTKENAFFLKATTILAKHDETYMPPEVARAIEEKKKGTFLK